MRRLALWEFHFSTLNIGLIEEFSSVEFFTDANLKPLVSPQQDVNCLLQDFWCGYGLHLKQEYFPVSLSSLFPTGIIVTPLEERNGRKQLLQCLFEGNY